MILPDLLRPGLALVFCGTAPSRVSKEQGAYYAHPGNLFWPTLFATGLTDRRLAPGAYPELLAFGIGLTDLNKAEWGADADLDPNAFDVGAFRTKMRAHRPAVIAFTSKTAGAIALDRRIIACGLQSERLGDSRLVVLPSPSGRARRFFDIGPWQALARLVAETRKSLPADGS